MPYMLESSGWKLIRDEGKRYLIVRCGTIAEYHLLMELNDEENEKFRCMGWIFIQYLAHYISSFPRKFEGRNISGSIEKKVWDLLKQENQYP